MDSKDSTDGSFFVGSSERSLERHVVAFEVFDEIGALAFDKADGKTGADVEGNGKLIRAALNNFESCEIRIIGGEILDVGGRNAGTGRENKLHVVVGVGHKLEATAMEDGHGNFIGSGGDFEDKSENRSVGFRFFRRWWC